MKVAGRESPFVNLLGLELISCDRNTAVLACEAKPQLLNSMGIVHGGVLATLIDCGAGMLAYALVAENEAALTVDMNVSYFKNVSTGTLRCTATLVNRGERLLRVDVLVEAEGKKLAQGGVSMMIVVR